MSFETIMAWVFIPPLAFSVWACTIILVYAVYQEIKP